MKGREEKRKILEIIDTYVRAFERADADLMGSLFWVDDPRFIEVENHIAEPFDRERFLAIMDWIRKHQKPGWKMRFYDTKVHILSPEVAYSVSLRDQSEDGEVKTSRVTLVFLKKENEWKIIHGHFSYVPK
jgi:ketosteroid isomerase-like protein